MSVNLLNVFKETVGDQFGSQLGGLFNEPADKASSALEGIVPSIIGGLMNKASTTSGASEISDFLDNNDDGGLLDNLGILFSGNDNSALIKMGSGLLKNLFGNKFDAVIDAVTSISGMTRESSGGMLGLLVPIVLSVLKKQKSNLGLDAGGLRELLLGQKEHVAPAMPAGLADRIGLGDLLGASQSNPDDTLLEKGIDTGKESVKEAASEINDKVKEVADSGKEVVNDAASSTGDFAEKTTDNVVGAAQSSGSALAKLVPLVLIAALAFFLWKFFFGGDKKETPSDSGAKIESVETTKMTNTPLPADLTADNAEVTVSNLFKDLNGTLEGITDADSAKAALPALAKSTVQISWLEEKLNALPAAAQAPIRQMVGEKLEPMLVKVRKLLEMPVIGDLLFKKLGPVVETLKKISQG